MFNASTKVQGSDTTMLNNELLLVPKNQQNVTGHLFKLRNQSIHLSVQLSVPGMPSASPKP